MAMFSIVEVILKGIHNLYTECPAPSSKTSSDVMAHMDPSPSFIKDICTSLIEGLEYRSEDPVSDENVTYLRLRSEVTMYDDGGKWFDAMCREATSLAELPYPDCTPEMRFYLAKFTWFLINIDDLGHKYPSYLEGFQERVLAKESPEGTILKSFLEALSSFYRFWDPIPANCMSHAAMDFINGCLLEQIPSIRDMKLSSAAKSWPYFLRRKTGTSATYAFAIFPKDLNIDMSVYIQAIDDIILFIDLVNDVLSFYKEYLVGERNNYVYNRAHVDQKSIPETLQDIVTDVLAAHARVTKVLEHTEAAHPWRRFANGFVAFHVTLKRYRLSELGF